MGGDVHLEDKQHAAYIHYHIAIGLVELRDELSFLIALMMSLLSLLLLELGHLLDFHEALVEVE